MQKLTDYITEGLKDETRINDIVKKSNGNAAKEIQLATSMATKITQKQKGLDRYKAALDILGPEHEVTKIFAKRATELGNSIAGLKQEEIKAPLTPETRTSKLATDIGGSALTQGRPASEIYRYAYRGRGPEGTPILPCGALNLTTGNNKYFNLYDNGEGTVEIYSANGKHVAVVTSGSKPMLKIGESNAFNHDQNGRPLFYGKLVDWINVNKDEKSLLEIKRKYGINSMSMYVYK